MDRGVWRGDIWGERLSKYRAVAVGSKSSIIWTRLEPDGPDWLFRAQDIELGRQYRAYWSVATIFAPVGDPAPGVVTTHDSFAISFTPDEARSKVVQLLSTSSESDARSLWKLCSQSQWNYERAKTELPSVDLGKATVSILYQPFDSRWTIWDRNVAVHRRERVNRHMLTPNLALNVIRKMDIAGEWSHVLISGIPISHHAVSSKEVNFTFPLRLVEESVSQNSQVVSLIENLSPDFRSYIDSRYEHHYTPEEILGYIYAVLHAPTYRARYAEFLRSDFPRVPFPEDAGDFESLSSLGWGLVQAHLLRDFPRRDLAGYRGQGDHAVEGVRYAPAEQAIHINKTQCFNPVPKDVWDFHIGGYQVLDKYLKSRKGRTLSLDEVNHLGAIADSLAFTIERMSEIDAAYRAAFSQQAG